MLFAPRVFVELPLDAGVDFPCQQPQPGLAFGRWRLLPKRFAEAEQKLDSCVVRRGASGGEGYFQAAFAAGPP